MFEMSINHVLDVVQTDTDVNRNAMYEKYFDYIFPNIKKMFHLHKTSMKNVYNLKDIFNELFGEKK